MVRVMMGDQDMAQLQVSMGQKFQNRLGVPGVYDTNLSARGIGQCPDVVVSESGDWVGGFQHRYGVSPGSRDVQCEIHII